jgi:hypothetical protein
LKIETNQYPTINTEEITPEKNQGGRYTSTEIAEEKA